MERAANCTSGADDTFGPLVQIECRGGFDFTVLFERTILTLLPATAFLLAFIARTVQLARTDVKTVATPLRIVKLAAVTSFIGVQIALLVLYQRDASNRSAVSVAVATVNLLVAIQLAALSWLEDSRSVRPSTLLTLYLFSTIILDLAQARSLWLLGNDNTLAGLFSANLAVKLALLILEAQQKRDYLKQPYQNLSPESTSGIISRSFLFWINVLFQRGFRTSISSEDLFPLDEDLSSEKLKARLQDAWNKRQQPERRFELIWILSRALWRPLLRAVLPRLCVVALTFTQPFLIASVLQLVTGPDGELTASEAYGLTAATGVIYISMAVFDLHYRQSLTRCLTMARGALVALIYDRALTIPDGLYDEATAVTLMSSDTALITGSLENVHNIWAYLVQVGVGLFLLARQMGWVCIMPLAVVAVATLLASKITLRVAGHQKLWVEAVQKRVGTTAIVLSEMRSIKMLGLSNLMTDALQKLRIQETEHMAHFRWNIVWKNVISTLCAYMSPPVTFAAYGIQAAVRHTSTLDLTQSFSSLSIISLLTGPFSSLIQTVPLVAAGIGSFDRVQKFLTETSRSDSRQSIPQAPQQSGDEKRDLSDTTSPGHNAAIHAEAEPPKLAVSINGIYLRPTPTADVVLHEVSFNTPKGSLTMITGPVASGKSTLVKAILGEGSYERGTVSVADRRIAYCGQTPWLPNTTIQKAICGHISNEEIDWEWYHSCIRACALDRDFDSLPDGDQTSIGGGSTTLSGGQKHRVALARAVYSRAQIAVLDSVLGALDGVTKTTVVESLFGANGLFKQTCSTVFLVTQEREYLRYADQLIILSDGGLKYNGTYAEAVELGTMENISLAEGKEKGSNERVTKLSTSKKLPYPTPTAIDLEDLNRKTGDFSLYRYYFGSIKLGHALTLAFFITLEVSSATFSQIWFKMWSEAGGGQFALYASVYMILPFITAAGIGGFVWAFFILIAPASSNKLHFILLKTVMRAPQMFFTATDIGSLLNRFSQDMTLIESALAISAAMLFLSGMRVAAGIGLVATGSVYLTATIPVVFLAIFCLQHIYLRTSRQLRYLDLESKSPLYSHFLETLGGLATVRALGWQKDNQVENIKLLDLSQRPQYLLQSCQQWLNLVLQLIIAAEATLVVGLAVGLRHLTSPGLLGVSLVNVFALETNLSFLVRSWTELETSLGAVARTRDFEKEVKPEHKQCEDFQPPPKWPEHGGIEFRGVTASHSPTAVALRDLSLVIKPGQKVGICGRTGSGKSSLVGTLLRLLELNEGTVIIDGVDLARIPRDVIRERLVAVPQDPLILVGTVRFNADPHSRASDEDITNALSVVGLWDTLKERGGLDAEITASSLSVGQQKLFALSRAILQKGQIILLDEPTSNIDSGTDNTIRRILKEKCASCTILTIAHRIDTILESDVVLVIEDGQVVEMRTPQELMGMDSRFSGLMNN
ncbi:ABC transporter [Thozetella sp. PMI_491]|nr:ABC transporter [Thozetella sp. PMI_491]